MFQFIRNNFYTIYTLNRSYTGKVIGFDNETVFIHNPLIIDLDSEDEFKCDVSINQRMIEAVIEAEKE